MMNFCSLRHRGCRRCHPCYLSRYDMTLQFLRTLFLRTRNVHYCTLRAELLMALHDLEIQVRLRPRPFRWNRNLLYFWLPVDLNQLQFVAVATRLSAALLDLLSISFTFFFLINFGFECQYCSEANVCLEFQPLSPMGHDAAFVRIGSRFLRYQACLIGIGVFLFSAELVLSVSLIHKTCQLSLWLSRFASSRTSPLSTLATSSPGAWTLASEKRTSTSNDQENSRFEK